MISGSIFEYIELNFIDRGTTTNFASVKIYHINLIKFHNDRNPGS